MALEYSYMVVIGLLVLLGMYYFSPYELKVNEEEGDE
jgi:hypothetical protein